MGVTPRRIEIFAITLFMGCAAAIAQAVIIRELLSVCRGNELIIGVIFASWFFGVFIGARANQPAESSRLYTRVRVSLILLPLMTLVSAYGGRAVELVFPRGMGHFYSLPAEMLMSFLFTAPTSFAVGFFFPPLVALIADFEKNRAGGTIFYVESIGSFIGGAAFSFLLVELTNPISLASVLCAASLVLILRSERRAWMIIALFPLILTFFSGDIEKAFLSRIWTASHPGRLEAYRRTRHQTLVLERYGGTVNVYGDGALIYSFPDRYEARGPFHLINALRGRRARLLVMGTGTGSILHNLLATDVAHISYFESDPAILDFTRFTRNDFYPDDGRYRKLQMRAEDMRHALTVEGERYDMIVSLPPAPTSIMINRFYTREFFSLCRRRLSRDGVFVTAIHGFSNYISSELRDFIASVYRGFTAEFPFTLVTSGETVYLIGATSSGVLPNGVDELAARYSPLLPLHGRFEPETADGFSADELRMFFEKTQIDSFRAAMKAAVVDENRDLKPGAYWRNILLAAFREGTFIHAVLRGVFFIPLLLVVLSFFAVWDVRHRHGTKIAWAGLLMFLTGMVSISSIMVMVVIYQNATGMVYHRIALINGVFMLGLAAGSFFATRRSVPTLAVFTGIGLSLGLMLSQTYGHSEACYWFTLVIFSAFCGAAFPTLFSAIVERDFFGPASVLDAMDHFGSIVGSLLSVTLMVPFAGIRGTILVNAAACALCAVAIVARRHKRRYRS